MSWTKKRLKDKPSYNLSLIKKLRKSGKLTPEFETQLVNLSLEELIGVKLELASRAAGGMMYGMPIWHSLPMITKDALLKYALSCCQTKTEAARLLGIDKVYLSKLIKKFEVNEYFLNDND